MECPKRRRLVPTLRPIGAKKNANGTTRFTVWAPRAKSVELHIIAPGERRVEMTREERGYFSAEVDGCDSGTRYLYDLGEFERPDPASRHQPDGVHEASALIDDAFAWSDATWRGLPLREYRIYELHVGTFTAAGTFDAVIPHLDRLRDLGVTAIEIMPVAQFPGERNWGYDGVYPFAAQDSYGGPDGLRRLVDACHARGLAAILDVVYNHLGPEGNYLRDFGPYFTDRYKTPWGEALNFDGAGSDEVRNYFLNNAVQWIETFHFDGLRLDAVHAIVDTSARPFLQELAEVAHAKGEELRREIVLIAESDLNDPRVIRPPELGGFGLDAQWADDLHHALHVVLTGERSGYYADYGTVTDVARIMENGYLFTGQYSAFRERRFGAPVSGLDGSHFVVCIQNHDQVGNRMKGDRLAAALSPAQQRIALATIILSPFTPMLFMGEEYGEENPFQYFMSHSDPQLVEAVRNGRKEEFASFAWSGEVPDPADEATFHRSKLNAEAFEARRQKLQSFVRELMRLRASRTALRNQDLASVRATAFDKPRVLFMTRSGAGESLVVVLHYDDERAELTLPFGEGTWERIFASEEGFDASIASDGEARLTIPAHGCAVYRRK